MRAHHPDPNPSSSNHMNARHSTSDQLDFLSFRSNDDCEYSGHGECTAGKNGVASGDPWGHAGVMEMA